MEPFCAQYRQCVGGRGRRREAGGERRFAFALEKMAVSTTGDHQQRVSMLRCKSQGWRFLRANMLYQYPAYTVSVESGQGSAEDAVMCLVLGCSVLSSPRKWTLAEGQPGIILLRSVLRTEVHGAASRVKPRYPVNLGRREVPGSVGSASRYVPNPTG